MDRKNRRLFAGCDNKMMAVVDADTGKVIATPAIGEGVDANGFDPLRTSHFVQRGRNAYGRSRRLAQTNLRLWITCPPSAPPAPWASTLKTQNIFSPPRISTRQHPGNDAER